MNQEEIEIRRADEEFVNIFETDWYREIRADTTPGDVLKIYREKIIKE